MSSYLYQEETEKQEFWKNDLPTLKADSTKKKKCLVFVQMFESFSDFSFYLSSEICLVPTIKMQIILLIF